MQNFVEMLPQSVKDSPESLGAFLYSCTAVSHNEASALEAALGMEIHDVAFQVCCDPIMGEKKAGWSSKSGEAAGDCQRCTPCGQHLAAGDSRGI